MSYILDALKKAEKERKLGKRPDFTDNHGMTPQRPKRRPALYAAIFILIAIAGGLGWWFGHEKPSVLRLPFQSSGAKPEETTNHVKSELRHTTQPTSNEPAQATQPPTASIEKPPVSISERQNTTAPTPKPSKPKEATPIEKAGSMESGVQKQTDSSIKFSPNAAELENGRDPKKLYNYYELPDDIKKGLPEPVISTHIYSQEKEDRLVSINGNIGREGQKLSPDLKIEAIQPDGAIVNYRGYRIKIKLR